LYNKVVNNFEITDKAYLYQNLFEYSNKNPEVLEHIPNTFIVNKYSPIHEVENLFHLKTLWILKPGTSSNRGNGIKIIQRFEELKEAIDQN